MVYHLSIQIHLLLYYHATLKQQMSERKIKIYFGDFKNKLNGMNEATMKERRHTVHALSLDDVSLIPHHSWDSSSWHNCAGGFVGHFWKYFQYTSRGPVVCMHACVCVCVCVCARVFVHVSVHVCVHVCACVCMHACMHACVIACVLKIRIKDKKDKNISFTIISIYKLNSNKFQIYLLNISNLYLITVDR